MAYDEELAERVRAALGAVPDVVEIKMFGGLCYTVRGHMAVGVASDDLMVRMEPEAADAALSEPGARPMDFTGKPMRGFLYVGPDGVRTERALEGWVRRGWSTHPPSHRRSRNRGNRARSRDGVRGRLASGDPWIETRHAFDPVEVPVERQHAGIRDPPGERRQVGVCEVEPTLRPSAQLAPLAIGAQVGLWTLYGILHLRRKFNRERPLRRRSQSYYP